LGLRPSELPEEPDQDTAIEAKILWSTSTAVRVVRNSLK
jgi:hypothetical protein